MKNRDNIVEILDNIDLWGVNVRESTATTEELKNLLEWAKSLVEAVEEEL